MPNLLDLINSNNYFIYFILQTGTDNIEKIKGCFVFKKTSVFISKNQELISCIASIKDPLLKKEEYFEAFKIALGMIKLPFTHPMAYFFHNFIFNTILANKVIILGT